MLRRILKKSFENSVRFSLPVKTLGTVRMTFTISIDTIVHVLRMSTDRACQPNPCFDGGNSVSLVEWNSIGFFRHLFGTISSKRSMVRKKSELLSKSNVSKQRTMPIIRCVNVCGEVIQEIPAKSPKEELSFFRIC